jgi:hypothetical protein
VVAEKLQKTVQELLRDAAGLLEQASSKVDLATVMLDMRFEECPCCNRRRYTRWDHARTYGKITDTPTHLKSQAAKLRGEADKLDANQNAE